MLQAMNTGHDGSLSTIHANTPRDALSRVETMVLMAGYELPVKAIRQQVASALDLIIQLERLQDGSRRVTSITEVGRMESDVITLSELFRFKVDAVQPDGTVVGSLRSTGLRPTFLDKFERRGITLPPRCSPRLAPGRPTTCGASRREARARSSWRSSLTAVLAPAGERGGRAAVRGRRQPASPIARTRSRSRVRRGSTAAQVQVTENGRPVRGVSVSQADGAQGRRFGVVLAIDTSGSMHGRPLARGPAGRRAFVAPSRSRPARGDHQLRGRRHGRPRFTTDGAAIDQALQAVQPGTGGSRHPRRRGRRPSS